MKLDNKLFVKYVVGDTTPEELKELLEWRNSSMQNRELFTSLTQLRISYRYMHYNTPDRIAQSFRQLNRRITKGTARYWLGRISACAAMLTILFALSYGGWQYFHQPDSYTTIIVGEGEQIKKITLEDGTLVWLNRHSSLTIPASFSTENRKVKVDGEVYFDVKKSLGSPFLVDAGEVNVKVIGTSFNVNTEKNGNKIEAVLVTGKILLVDDADKTLLEMSPGEKVTFTPERNEFYVETVDVNISAAWHLDQLTFESVTLREIVNKLSAIYDVNINLESKKMAERRFRCVINRDESLVEVLDILTYLAHIRYQIEGDEVFISEQP